ncbi:cAMP-binding domain of CRP or a regulatory subunit of cAMP-dependent protein kinases [Aquimarina amphilecti]|uniref:cAMP-binding domain of CRP or a regulatory subunit of cAMP-dependent protein kinases n=1 Tax=Aquimarina amphilecti TaxID=1038014 RepID=A0A1H7GF99_AQUAM|nr:Crp/Fnr family transcriptional regulator [Aquimarina amphilecti]SEK36811.1 cAMP-binding domain of CRP or a regulatory subunit of cAMP-dependent protein kinases [Aquimarina amphilecti]
MDTSILEFLNKAGSFSEEESSLLQNEVKHRELKKNEFLLRKGEICSSLHFVISGSFYQYFIDTDLNMNIIDLGIKNDWVINHKSFTGRKPSEYEIQAFENSSVYELNIDSIHKLIAISPTFFQIGKVLEESTARVSFFDNNNTPDEKYEYILKNKPLLFQKFPQKIIASFLKITPETLSRVRKRIT